MTGQSSSETSIPPSRVVRRAVLPRETWSAISKLPDEIAEQVRLERQLELTPAIANTDG
jgi:hypothetical protein